MNIDIIHFVIVSIIAILLGQLTLHLTKKLPPVVKEEITYKEFFKSLRNDFKVALIPLFLLATLKVLLMCLTLMNDIFFLTPFLNKKTHILIMC